MSGKKAGKARPQWVSIINALTKDRDRVLSELAAIYAEANKSGRCNGDPVALIKQGQHDSDRVVELERKLREQSSTLRNDTSCDSCLSQEPGFRSCGHHWIDPAPISEGVAS